MRIVRELLALLCVYALVLVPTHARGWGWGWGHSSSLGVQSGTGGAATAASSSDTVVATFWGGTPGVVVDGEEEIRGCIFDSDGNLVVAGLAEDNTVTTGGWDTTFNGAGTTGLRHGDSWIAKWSADLTQMQVASYIGGSSTERSMYSIIEAPNGEYFGCGHTESSDFPTQTGAYQAAAGGGWDGYCVRFSHDLTSMIDATYLGGALEDAFRGGIDYDVTNDQILVSGKMVSTGLASGAVQATPGGGPDENYWTVLSQDLGSLIEGEYDGTSNVNTTEATVAIKYSAATPTSVWVHNQSPETGHVNGLTTAGPTDGTTTAQTMSYVIRYDDVYGTRSIGCAAIPAAPGTHSGANNFADVGMVEDSAGNIYVTGGSGITTLGFGITDPAFPNAYDGGGDCYITKLNSSCVPQWTRWLGGTGTDVCTGLTIDANDIITTVGYTSSTDWDEITPDAYQSTHSGGTNDAIIVRLNSDGRIVYGSFWGGAGDDRFRQLCQAPDGRIAAVGRSASTWVPGLRAPAQTQAGGGINDQLYTIWSGLPTTAASFFYEEQFEGGTCAALGYTVTSGAPNCQYTTAELSGTQSVQEPAGTSVAMVNATDIFNGQDIDDLWFSFRIGIRQPIGESSGRIWLFSRTAGSTSGANRTGPSIIVGAASPNQNRIDVWCEHDAVNQIPDEGGTTRTLASGEHVFVGQWDQTGGVFRLWLDPTSTQISDLLVDGSITTPTGAGLDNYWEIACSDPSAAEQPEAWGFAISDFTADTPEVVLDEVIISSSSQHHPGTMRASSSRLSAGPDTKLILETGQSLTTGTDASPALTTTQPYDSIFATSPYGALLESTVETNLSSAIEQIRANNTNGHLYAASTDGAGGNTITQLRESVTFTNLIGRPATYIAANGPAEVAALLFIQGHSDGQTGCGTGNCVGIYEAQMSAFLDDFQGAVIADTDQRDYPPMFAIQASSASKNLASLEPGFSLMQAQLNAALLDPDIFLVAARYHFGSTPTPHYDAATTQDGVHIGNTGQRLMGEYLGEAYWRTREAPGPYKPWRPLYPVTAYIDPADSTVIEVVMHSPCRYYNTCSAAPLVIDTTNVRAVNRANGETTYGLSVNDPGTQPRAIESVTIKAAPHNSILRVQLDGTVQAGTVLGFADLGEPTTGAGNGFSTAGGGDRDAPRTNLRDSHNAVGVNSGETLYNWAVHARIAVPGGAAPAAAVATLLDDVKWTWLYSGTNSNPSGSTWTADVGGVDLALTGTDTGYDTNLGSLGALSAAVGATRIDEAWAWTGTNASWQATDALFDTGTDEDLWIRWIGDCTTPAAIESLFWYGDATADPDEYRLQAQSSGTLSFIYESNGANLTNNFASALPSAPGPTLCLIDAYVDKQDRTGNLSTTICVNGACDVAVGTGAGGSNDGEQIALMGARNSTQPFSGRVLAIAGKKGAGCDGHNGFSETRHAADWAALQ